MRPALLALVAVACVEFRVDRIDPDEVRERAVVEESFVQAPLAGVDLLLVVDDTASMAREQEVLARDLPALAEALDATGVHWHLGVTSTDMVGPEAGWLRGSPWLVTWGMQGAGDMLGQAAQVGLQGLPPEAGLAAAIQAVALAQEDGPNAGFRRPDAALHVVLISDDDDHSDGWLGDDPTGAFLAFLDDETERTGQPAVASAIVGDVPFGCASADGAARPAPRYHEVVTMSGGAVASICAVDFEPLLAQVAAQAVELPTRFPLRERPVPGSLRVVVDGQGAEGDFLVEDGDAPAVRFHEPPPPGARIEVRYLVELSS